MSKIAELKLEFARNSFLSKSARSDLICLTDHNEFDNEVNMHFKQLSIHR